MVIDTRIFIEHLRAKDKLSTTLYLFPDNVELFISSVTMYELYMAATAKEKENDIRKLNEDLPMLPFTDTVAIY
jgi:predicted nucleic acid-binding protein